MSQKNIFEPTLTEKIAGWVGKRYAIILSLSALSVSLSAIAVMYISASKEKQLRVWQEIAKNMSDKVIVATVDGRVAVVDKKPIQPEIARAVINNFVRHYFLFDIQHLFGGLNTSAEFQDFKHFLKNSPLVKEWLKAKFVTKESSKQFLALLRYYYGLYQNQNLLKIPYTMYYAQPVSENFKLDDKTGLWSYNAEWVVEITAIKPDNKLVAETGKTVIRLTGKFEPFNGNALNPLGIKILSIQYRPVLANR